MSISGIGGRPTIRSNANDIATSSIVGLFDQKLTQPHLQTQLQSQRQGVPNYASNATDAVGGIGNCTNNRITAKSGMTVRTQPQVVGVVTGAMSYSVDAYRGNVPLEAPELNAQLGNDNIKRQLSVSVPGLEVCEPNKRVDDKNSPKVSTLRNMDYVINHRLSVKKHRFDNGMPMGPFKTWEETKYAMDEWAMDRTSGEKINLGCFTSIYSTFSHYYSYIYLFVLSSSRRRWVCCHLVWFKTRRTWYKRYAEAPCLYMLLKNR